MRQQHLWLIHGNLQTPAVWDDFKGLQQPNFCIHKVNLWDTAAEDFWSWAKTFTDQVHNQQVHNQQVQNQANAKECSHHLIGYSLGGRLALHALYYATSHVPELWSSVTITAADTGLSNKVAKSQQLDWDTKWANKFLTEDWDTLLSEWNDLAVFCGREAKHSLENGKVARAKIAKLFVTFSKGKQAVSYTHLTLPTTPYV